jgi:hypothetical protein
MSFKPEVRVVNDSHYYRNALVFATEAEALRSARDLMLRWFAVEDCRAVEVDEEVTHRLVDGNLEYVTK